MKTNLNFFVACWLLLGIFVFDGGVAEGQWFGRRPVCCNPVFVRPVCRVCPPVSYQPGCRLPHSCCWQPRPIVVDPCRCPPTFAYNCCPCPVYYVPFQTIITFPSEKVNCGECRYVYIDNVYEIKEFCPKKPNQTCECIIEIIVDPESTVALGEGNEIKRTKETEGSDNFSAANGTFFQDVQKLQKNGKYPCELHETGPAPGEIVLIFFDENDNPFYLRLRNKNWEQLPDGEKLKLKILDKRVGDWDIEISYLEKVQELPTEEFEQRDDTEFSIISILFNDRSFDREKHYNENGSNQRTFHHDRFVVKTIRKFEK